MTAEPMKVDIFLAQAGFDPRNKITLDGIDITNRVRALTIDASVDDITRLTLELCRVDVTLNGEAIVNGIVIPIAEPEGDAAE